VFGPRNSVVSGSEAVQLNGRAAAVDARVPVGATLGVAPGGAVTVRYGKGCSFTLSGKARFGYAGRTRAEHRFLLEHGKVFLRVADDGPDTLIRSGLGTVRCPGGTFEVYATAAPVGIAIDTPRILRVSVAEGTAGVRVAGHPAESELVPSGVKAEVLEGEPRIILRGGLGRGEWKLLAGSERRFADAELPAAEIPSGVWVPRNPGRKGPTPGSRTKVRMFYSSELSGGILLPDLEDRDAWRYSAAEDRWHRLVPEKLAKLRRPDSRTAPDPPEGSSGAAIAYSPRAAAFLLYGRVGRGAETWVCRDSEGAWRRLRPAANPPPRTRHAMYYDAAADLFVLYGGDAHGRAHDDTWVFRLKPAR
jgi:hypothetical protein